MIASMESTKKTNLKLFPILPSLEITIFLSVCTLLPTLLATATTYVSRPVDGSATSNNNDNNDLNHRVVLLTDGEVRQYCQWETFNATCHMDEVIIMQSARYGRMGFGGCVKENHGHVGCSADVLSHLDQKCSGRHKCILHIPDATLHKIHACPKELMSYLEAKYTCVKGKWRLVKVLRLLRVSLTLSVQS